MSKNINKVFLFLICYLLLLSCTASTTNFYIKEDRSKFPIKSFVHIKATINFLRCVSIEKQSICIDEPHTSTASGVSIGSIQDSSIILTAGHLCEVDKEELPGDVKSFSISITVKDYLGNTAPAKIIMSSMAKPDICSLIIDGHKIEGLKVATKEPDVGTTVYSMSAPFGIFHPPAVPILQGIYSGPRAKKDFSVVTIRATGGSSGSAILNERMELIGILFATHPAFNTITLISTYPLTTKFIFDTLQKVKSSH